MEFIVEWVKIIPAERPSEFVLSECCVKIGAIRVSPIINDALTTDGVKPEMAERTKRMKIATIFENRSFTLKSFKTLRKRPHQSDV